MMQEVESFKCHLEQLSDELGFRNIIIKLFEEVFTHEEMSSGVEIQTVLAKCRYVFVYVSKNFMAWKLKRFGIKKCWIRNVLTTPETPTRIKIVSDCEPGQLPDEPYLSIKLDTVFLDYFKYKRKCQDDIEKYKQAFEDLIFSN